MLRRRDRPCGAAEARDPRSPFLRAPAGARRHGRERPGRWANRRRTGLPACDGPGDWALLAFRGPSAALGEADYMTRYILYCIIE
jgi:hypothetical protein